MENLYPWSFGINISVFEPEDINNIGKFFSESGYNNNLFLRYFYNLLVRKGKFVERLPTYSEIVAFKLICEIYFHITFSLAEKVEPDYLLNILLEQNLSKRQLSRVKMAFLKSFPLFDLSTCSFLKIDLLKTKGDKKFSKKVLANSLITRVMNENPACKHFRLFFSDENLLKNKDYKAVMNIYKMKLKEKPIIPPFNKPILEVLYEPIKRNPDSILKQLDYIKSRWIHILPPQILEEFEYLKAIVEEENIKKGVGGPGPVEVLEFKKVKKETMESYEYPEYEAYTPDTDWMPNVVLIAKMAFVWLYQLSKQYHRPIRRLDEIPDEELDKLARWGFNALWLIGIWERSPASQKIKHLCGNIDASASAYSLYDYVIAEELGGWSALDNLKKRAWVRGIRLACDIVPNHMGIASKWIYEHPDWFLQCDFSPYPNYKFTGENLSTNPDFIIQIEDGYYTRTDAAVVFKFQELKTGKIRYIYHGNDGTSTPWNDTAQLNYLLPEVREAMLKTIVDVAKHFPIIRFDAAMTLAKKHYQRLWFPLPGHGSGVPSRTLFCMSRADFEKAMPKEFWREVVEKINLEVPDTLLIAEAFWLMEGYFVRTLGMHRVYNSAFMNMLKMEENAKYRQTIKNILEFDARILQRFVNFMNNPDEKTAVEQFGKGDKYFGVAVMLVTMPGLPMFGHGQIEGFHEKYGMEYKRAYYDEQPDQYFISQHEQKIFPLMRRRRIFSGSENFYLFDFYEDEHRVNENVFVYSNRYGNERALIIYNNSYGTFKGKIKNSVRYLKKESFGKEYFDIKSLGDALLFKNEHRFFYKFKDYNSGMEYLVNGKDIFEKGFEIEVKGYQYYAFLDFQEIYDREGYWRKLYERLDNKPVKCLDAEFKIVKYENFHRDLRLLYQYVLEIEIYDNKVLKDIEVYISKVFSHFYYEQNQDISEELIKDLSKLLNDLQTFLEDEKKVGKQFVLIFITYLVFMKISSKFVSYQDFLNETSASLVIREVIKKAIEDRLIDTKFVNLHELVNVIFKYLKKGNSLIFDEVFEELFLSDNKIVIGTNIYENIEWFIKELFEVFVICLVLMKYIELSIEEKEKFFKETKEIIKIAELSNYRTDVFLKLYKSQKSKQV